MGYETLIVERQGEVDRVTLNRPDRLNTLDDTMIAELSGNPDVLVLKRPDRPPLDCAV
ncbi:MAG: hypothetical protein J0I75_07085 [Hyphomicrobium sp.]|nr:hypothetical protein [Hyphomicrobium sp.]